MRPVCSHPSGPLLAAGICVVLSALPLHGAGVFVASAGDVESEANAMRGAPAHRAILYCPGGDRQTLLLQPTYHGPAQQFCWIIPVPSHPGRTDVFLASQDFMDAVFDRTRLVVETEIIDSTHREKSREKANETVAAGRTTVDMGGRGRTSDRLEVGDYGVAVLSARSARRLTTWLKRAGYAAPEGLEAIARSYADRGWQFVAVKVYPAIEDERPVLKPLKPIGIHVRSPRAVYPLAVSRVGARARTAVELVVIAPTPVTCETLPTTDMSGDVSLKPGGYYESHRIRLAGDGLVREAVVRGPCAYQDLHYDALRWVTLQKAPWQGFWATRFWGWPPPDKLADLTFRPDETVKPFRVHVARRHVLPGPRSGLWHGASGRVVALVAILLAVGVAIWSLGLSADQRGGEGRSGLVGPPAAYAGRLLLYVGALLLVRPALLALAGSLHLLQGTRLFMSGQLALPVTIIWACLIGVWSLTALHFIVHALREGPESRWGFWVLAIAVGAPVLSKAVLLPSAEMREAAELGSTLQLGIAQFAAMLAITALAGFAAHMATASVLGPVRSQFMAGELGLLCAVTLVAAPVVYTPAPEPEVEAPRVSKRAVIGALDRSLQTLRTACEEFRDESGCYPEALSALARRAAPQFGLDAAGNRVPVPTRRPAAAYLSQVPVDPLTDSARTWVYDPLMPDLVTSGGFRTEVSAPADEVATRPPSQAYWQLPGEADLRQALGPAARMMWGLGDTLVRIEGRGADGVMVRAVAISTLRAAIVRVREVGGLEQPRLAASPGGTGLVLSCVVRRHSAGDARATSESEQTAVFDVSGAGHRLTPLGMPIQGRLEGLQCSVDGVRVAGILTKGRDRSEGRELWALGDTGEWQGPLAENVARLAWHPSGAYMLALVLADEELAEPEPKRVFELVRVWLDGRVDPLAKDRRYTDRLLATTRKAVFAISKNNALHRTDLRSGHTRVLETGAGDVMDLMPIGGERVAALVVERSEDSERARGRLLVFEGATRKLSRQPIAPRGAKWTKGRIIGRHEATGYFFLHLWSEDPTGGVVVLLGEKAGPAQKVARVERQSDGSRQPPVAGQRQ